ncbi:hypothetical protein MLD38_014374 [Melastoma candidum]|uniref:Uncharacterized protein n=1 Tax=Melastoma candidum TaxID=119954 RepID=A0ACB9RCI7_9MYRT|nr:hypothetical protein MLD38_014374 [Melastoma candidum]
MSEKDLSASMNVRIMGDGEDTIVLSHGYGADQSVWQKTAPALSKHFRVFLFDWCFSGSVMESNLYDPDKHSSYEAFADDLNLLLDENGLSSTIFIGHSMSGMIGCIASVKRPDLFKRLVLLGASPRYQNMDGYEGGFASEQIEEMMLNLEMNYDGWASFFANLVVGSNDPPSVNVFLSCLLRMNHDVALPMAKTVFYCDQREFLHRVTTPCTIIQVSNDIVVPNSVAYLMHDRIAGKSTVEMIDTDGHFPQLTAHEQLMDVLGGVLGFVPDHRVADLAGP